jgi:hypothetical protein|tara:strand:+ start:385 stop:504 length:120 start_codon:yes stop_codon:yes gene_type:complete
MKEKDTMVKGIQQQIVKNKLEQNRVVARVKEREQDLEKQ